MLLLQADLDMDDNSLATLLGAAMQEATSISICV